MVFAGGKARIPLRFVNAPHQQGAAGAKRKAAKGGGKRNLGECKWCALGQCWDHGQVEKTAKTQKKPNQKPALGGKFVRQVALKANKVKPGAVKLGKAKPVGVASKSAAGAVSAKSVLNCLVMKATKDNSPGQVEYETVSLGDNVNNGPFQSTLVIVALDPTIQYTGEVSDSKKEAEQNAAQVAVNTLTGSTPRKAKQQHQQPKAKAKAKGNSKATVKAVAKGPVKGTPKTANVAGVPNLQPKNLLLNGIQAILTRPVTKEDIVYEVEAFGDAPNQMFAARVVLNTIDEPETFQGKRRNNRKDAEHAAAEVALKQLKQKIDVAQQERQVRKAQKDKEYKEKREAEMEAKKAEEAVN